MRRHFAAVRASRLVITSLVLAAMLLLGSNSVCAQRLYGCNNAGQLFVVDPITGAGSYVCDLPVHPDPGATEIEFDEISGLAFVQARDGIFSGELFDILSCSAMGPLVPTNDLALNGLEYVSGVLYGTAIPNTCQPSILVTVDPMTGMTTVIGPTGKGPISGLAWDPVSETMYGVTGCWQLYGFAELVTIDIATGWATTVGSTGVHLGSIEFGADGVLYGGGNNRDGGRFYVINPATGAVTLVGPTGFTDVTGLALVSRLPAVECPSDIVISAYTTIPLLSLEGFRITNAGSVPSAFAYAVTAEGPATLVDQGDPASIAGTTPTLAPGESYTPPEAGLFIPAIRVSGQQIVTYGVGLVTAERGISCAAKVTFVPPVPVFIGGFDAIAGVGKVDLTWDIAADEAFLGFKVYRGLAGGSGTVDVTPGGLIPSGERAYSDETVRGGEIYEYTLGVVLTDRSEVRSQVVSVKTKPYAFALHQNTPNPFNPTTTISFTLPERGRVTLAIYDVRGRLVRTLVDESVGEGYQERLWDGKDAKGARVSSGVYFYTLAAGDRTITKKMLLLK
jgi:hypothetical protein